MCYTLSSESNTFIIQHDMNIIEFIFIDVLAMFKHIIYRKQQNNQMECSTSHIP